MIAKSRRHLTHDDIEVWNHVTRGVKRLKRLPRKIEAAPHLDAPKPDKKAPAPPGKMGKVKAAPPPATIAAPPKPAHKPLVPLEPKMKRRLGRGQTDVAARIDLHGMRQHEAHAALTHFLTDAHAADARLVLVITGKGKTANAGSFTGEREVGILRRMVPHWLGEPGLRNIVLGYEAATLRHGGEGAIYVRIRKGNAP